MLLALHYCSPIVVMLGNVGWDLRIFLLFYAILIAFFSMVMAVTGFGNTNATLNEDFYDAPAGDSDASV